MLGFKQFLLEENIKLPILVFDTQLTSDALDKAYNMNTDQLIEHLKKKLKEKNFDTQFIDSISHGKDVNGFIEISFQLTEADVVGDSTLNNKAEEILTVFCHIFNDRYLFDFDSLRVLIFSRMNFKVNFNTIYIMVKASSDFEKLTGLDKLIECRSLFLVAPGTIDGNVLSILKIKGIKHFAVFGFAKAGKEWPPIIRKYVVNKGSILDCQEELIKNGLKEYAKL